MHVPVFVAWIPTSTFIPFNIKTAIFVTLKNSSDFPIRNQGEAKYFALKTPVDAQAVTHAV